jgi:hypothetical protein
MAPVFILGFPRSGTTAMADGIAALGRHGRVNTEGHLLYHFMPGLELLTKGRVNPASIAADPDRRAAILARFRAFANATFSPRGDPEDTAWIDKTPDVGQVRAAAALGRLWPSARFIFLYRPPLEAIRSNLATFRPALEGNEASHAERWAALHATWRARRGALAPGTFLDIYHPDMKADPDGVATAVATLLELPAEDGRRLAAFWRDNPKINRPRDERSAAYEATALSPEAAAAVRAATEEECRHWPRIVAAAAAEHDHRASAGE